MRAAVVGGASGVPAGAAAGVLSGPEPDRIERLWKVLRKEAPNRGPTTFAEMRAAGSGVLERRGEDRDEVATPMTERFALMEGEPAVA